MQEDDAVVAKVGPVQCVAEDFCRPEPDRASEQRAEHVCDRCGPEPHFEENDQHREHEAEHNIRHQTTLGEGMRLICRIADRRNKDRTREDEPGHMPPGKPQMNGANLRTPRAENQVRS